MSGLRLKQKTCFLLRLGSPVGRKEKYLYGKKIAKETRTGLIEMGLNTSS